MREEGKGRDGKGGEGGLPKGGRRERGSSHQGATAKLLGKVAAVDGIAVVSARTPHRDQACVAQGELRQQHCLEF